MKFLDATAGSTHATNVAIKMYMPPAEAAEVLAICDRAQALEVEVQRLTPDDAHARRCRSQATEALVLQALTNATLLAAIMAVSPCFRATKVRDHLIHYKDNGTPNPTLLARYKFKRTPTRDTIAAILTRHGYMF